jgi:NAD(P) transhydrogenase subunit alpha
VIRGTTVIKAGEITWPPPPPKLSATPATAKRPRGCRACRKERPRPWRRRADVGHCARDHASSSAALCSSDRQYAPAAFLTNFTVFVLGCFVGYMVIWNVTPPLHTPLMSVTNAISSIIVIGALIQISPPDSARPAGPTTDPLDGDRRHRAHLHQHVRRLRGHAAHAGDVPEVGRRP